MECRHKKKFSIPRVWLMTDPRLEPGLFRAVQRLPQNSGVIFRHYQLEAVQRRALFRQVAQICRRRGHILLLAGSAADARRWRADGFHGNSRCPIAGRLLHSTSVHNAREMAIARRIHASIMLLSPLYATSSHPGIRALGLSQFRRLAPLSGKAKLIALGGMTRQKAALFSEGLIHGWAAIDAFKCGITT